MPCCGKLICSVLVCLPAFSTVQRGSILMCTDTGIRAAMHWSPWHFWLLEGLPSAHCNVTCICDGLSSDTNHTPNTLMACCTVLLHECLDQRNQNIWNSSASTAAWTSDQMCARRQQQLSVKATCPELWDESRTLAICTILQ